MREVYPYKVEPIEGLLSESRRELGFIAARRVSRVEGRLLRAADVGFMTCGRGHRILVRRAHGPAAALRR